MIQRIRKNKATRIIAVFLVLNLITQLTMPGVAYALTGGPSQPEVQSFEPIGTSQMVDPFTGDFVYNIPLMDVGGYPINISYHSGVTMDQEASWVGLGWNINAGVINRGMRGLPDDFKGEDQVKKEYNINTNWTAGLNAMFDLEIVGGNIFGFNLGFGSGIFYNNYKGIGYTYDLNTGISIGERGKTTATVGLGISGNSQQEGINLNPSVGLSVNSTLKDYGSNGGAFSAKLGGSFNTKQGFKALTLGVKAGQITQGLDDKAHETGVGFNGGGSIPFSPYSYVPQITMPMLSTGLKLQFGIGGEVYWVTPHGAIAGYYNEQRLLTHSQSLPGYGYMYADAGKGDESALHDFNREKDGSFSESTPALPLTNFTYDTYSVSGQGIGGMYRPYRNDKGTVYDHGLYNLSASQEGGGDIALGNLVKIGINVGSNFNYSTSGRWNNAAQQELSFKGVKDNPASPQYEPYYFKSAGEMTAINQDYFKEIGGEDPVWIDVNNDNNTQFDKENGENIGIKGGSKTTREKRNQAISILTADQAKYAALETEIKDYNPVDRTTRTRISRVDGNNDHAKAHHISEITVNRPDGTRYVYGIPAYNKIQQEVTFNVADRAANPINGQVTYLPGDNSVDNERGDDNYFNNTELPPYAHSYLLTASLSADYVDVTGNGPSNDDLGSYTKFNYTKHNDNYKWRIPYEANSANYSEGIKTTTQDDKGSYLYGEKEIWYLHSIETKTHIAQYYTSPRADGFGVSSKDGGRSTAPQNSVEKLDSITLYAKHDWDINKKNAVPIQTVHFEYDYSLCPNVHNNMNYDPGNPDTAQANSGKLTLKKIYFTYQNVLKGRLSPYVFNYSDFNPSYNLKGYNRWGHYKPNQATSFEVTETSGPLSNSDYPYVDQDDRVNKADKYASAWSLSAIQLPSGGKIKIEYESDDYAFVQDKRAMQLMNVVGLGSNPSSLNSQNLFENPSAESPNQYVLIDLPEAVSNKEEFDKKYLKDDKGERIQNIYFKFLFKDLDNGYFKNEFIPGYAQFDNSNPANAFGVYLPSLTGGKYKQAWIKLQKVDGHHPGTLAGRQMESMFLNSSGVPKGNDKASIARSLASISKGMDGPSPSSAQQLVLGKSFLRLYTPNYKKLGGGVRVKKITINDSWSQMVDTGSDFEYGETYEYTKQNTDGTMISSGVAEYEPMIGNEENPLRQPIAFSVKHLLAPDERYYLEEPLGESFYPGPSVGYSQVRVRNLKYDQVKRTATGFVQHEFYTARDFPVIVGKTHMDAHPDHRSWLKLLLQVYADDWMTVSQGYSIQLNNMHGQKKATWVYGEDQSQPVSGEEYIYKTDPANPKKLNNTVSTINKDGTVGNAIVGKEVDFIADMREQASYNVDVHVGVNLDVSLAFIFPVPIPSVWPSFSFEQTHFRSAVTTKVITSYGILDKVVTHRTGSRITTENIARDAATGEVLLTKTQNDFDDPLYNFTYPAHWAYDRMGMAYQNIGLKIPTVKIEAGKATSGTTNFASFFVRGDEVLSAVNNERLWVTAVNTSNPQSIELIRRNGSPAPNGNTSLTIVRSGRRNQQATPVGSVTALAYPNIQSMTPFSNVVDAGSVEFSDDWKDFCECLPPPVIIGITAAAINQNPFITGKAGNWRAKKSYLLLCKRNQSDVNRNTNIRDDGTYTAFSPFWIPASGRDWIKNSAQWTFKTEVTKFSAFGFELENKDTLGVYSSSIYGYANTQAVAVAHNSQYKEIGVDNFEDYDFTDCTDDHWSFKNYPSNITSQQAHTGKKSIQVGAKSKVSVEKKIQCRPPVLGLN